MAIVTAVPEWSENEEVEHRIREHCKGIPVNEQDGIKLESANLLIFVKLKSNIKS